MTSIWDIYQVIHKYRDGDMKLMENVYFYRQENINPGGIHQSQDLADGWQTEVLTPQLGTYPSTFVTYEIDVRNLFDPADTYVKNINVAGTRSIAASELLPTFNAVVATASVSSGLVRKGRKMFSAIFETDQSYGVLVPAGLAVFTIRAALYAAYIVLLLGGTKKYAPVIVQRVRVGLTPPYTYRLPETQAEAVWGYITSAVVSTLVSAQDTRKR